MMFSKLVILAVALVGAQAFPSGNGRVVGGDRASLGQFPHQVSLQYANKDAGISKPMHVCGGIILNQNWIATAGHCVTEIPQGPNAKYSIKAGIISLNANDAVERSIVKIQVNPKYQGGVNPNDIALMKMDSPLTLDGKNVKAALLPKKGDIPSGNGMLSGWGSTSLTTTPNYPDKLQYVELPFLTYKECASALVQMTGSSNPLEKTNVCTGPLSGGQGACSGDSGGPLVNYDKANNAVLQGIVSWGMVPCGTPGAPSVFTRVSAFLPFINDYINT